MTAKERIEIKLNLAKENLKEANEEYYKIGKENRQLLKDMLMQWLDIIKG